MALQYSYGIKNKYRPTDLIKNAYAWGSGPQYNQADVPNGLAQAPSGLTSDQFMQQFAYEWFQSGELSSVVTSGGVIVGGGSSGANLSNPPFLSGAAGRLHPMLQNSEGGAARILRGYIRRAEREVNVPMSNARLYFMFNPETIQRDYVSYLDSVALDPFNSVFQSKNDVAPPSFMDFSFSLFFDRQEEAADPEHPGVFVDYQFFDLVVRNVTPDDPQQSTATIPNNGVMMVNPRDIAVIFSPQLMVQGRPLNASVSFDKFTHRMTPTRMTIRLTIRVIYIGPYKDQVTYVAEEQQAEAAIPIEDDTTDVGQFGATTDPLTGSGLLAGPSSLDPEILKRNIDASYTIRNRALDWAISKCKNGHGAGRLEGSGDWTDCVPASHPKRTNAPICCDCSGLVVKAYAEGSGGIQYTGMHWEGYPGTSGIIDLVKQYPLNQVYAPLVGLDAKKDLLRGDLLIRDGRTRGPNGTGHIAFFMGVEGSQWRIFDAAGADLNPEVGDRLYNPTGPTSGLKAAKPEFTHLLRPTPGNR